MKDPRPAVHWFTSDLRLRDNPALALAARHGPVAAVFVRDPALLARHAAARRRIAFMDACLVALDADLAARGSRLVVLDGRAVDELPRIAARLGAGVVTHAVNHEPAARARETAVARALAVGGVTVERTDAGTAHPPGTVLNASGAAYLVYGPFTRAWAVRPVPAATSAPRRWVDTATLAGLGRRPPAPAGSVQLPPAGEDGARGRLAAFVRSGLARYAEERDFPGAEATSRLSYHFRWGTLSPAACRAAADAAARDPAARTGAAKWRGELAWRDFFVQLLAAHPRVAREPLRPLPIRWRTSARDFDRWREGRTGYPLVDAGMRELAASGFMHNRVRMVAASFLTRHLLIDWRLGERHFMAELLDGQLAQNDGNWQWVAGTGADAQPFHRIFSPVRQGERFDPDGTYVRRWVPELARVPAAHVHAPWTLAPLDRRRLCSDYPPPVVEHDAARARVAAAIADAERGRSRRRA
jgi:deoxyribodipyrimidine photo-lyase